MKCPWISCASARTLRNDTMVPANQDIGLDGKANNPRPPPWRDLSAPSCSSLQLPCNVSVVHHAVLSFPRAPRAHGASKSVAQVMLGAPLAQKARPSGCPGAVSNTDTASFQALLSRPVARFTKTAICARGQLHPEIAVLFWPSGAYQHQLGS